MLGFVYVLKAQKAASTFELYTAAAVQQAACSTVYQHDAGVLLLLCGTMGYGYAALPVDDTAA